MPLISFLMESEDDLLAHVLLFLGETDTVYARYLGLSLPRIDAISLCSSDSGQPAQLNGLHRTSDRRNGDFPRPFRGIK